MQQQYQSTGKMFDWGSIHERNKDARIVKIPDDFIATAVMKPGKTRIVEHFICSTALEYLYIESKLKELDVIQSKTKTEIRKPIFKKNGKIKM